MTREREREREILFSILLLNWPQWPGIGGMYLKEALNVTNEKNYFTDTLCIFLQLTFTDQKLEAAFRYCFNDGFNISDFPPYK